MAFAIPEGADMRAVEALIDQKAPNQNLFHAIRIEGQFKTLRTRSVPAQKRPFPHRLWRPCLRLLPPYPQKRPFPYRRMSVPMHRKALRRPFLLLPKPLTDGSAADHPSARS